MNKQTIQKVSALILGLVTVSALAYAVFGYEWWEPVPDGSGRGATLVFIHAWLFVFSLVMLIVSSSNDFDED